MRVPASHNPRVLTRPTQDSSSNASLTSKKSQFSQNNGECRDKRTCRYRSSAVPQSIEGCRGDYYVNLVMQNCYSNSTTVSGLCQAITGVFAICFPYSDFYSSPTVDSRTQTWILVLVFCSKILFVSDGLKSIKDLGKNHWNRTHSHSTLASGVSDLLFNGCYSSLAFDNISSAAVYGSLATKKMRKNNGSSQTV